MRLQQASEALLTATTSIFIEVKIRSGISGEDLMAAVDEPGVLAVEQLITSDAS